MIYINSKTQGLKTKTTKKHRMIILSTKHEQHGDIRKTSDDVLIFKVVAAQHWDCHVLAQDFSFDDHSIEILFPSLPAQFPFTVDHF